MRISAITLLTAFALCGMLASCGGGGGGAPSGGNSGGVTPPQTQTCLCTGGCTSSAGGNVANGRTAPATATLRCVAEASPQTCNSPQGCIDSNRNFVSFGSAVSASITLIPVGAATRTCTCTHGCMTGAGTLVSNRGVATASETLRCQRDPDPPVCGSAESGTADCTIGCTANGSVYVPLNTAAPALTTTTTLTCRTEAPSGMQICECRYGCTDRNDSTSEFTSGGLAPDTVDLTCKGEPNPPVCGTATGTENCAFGCTASPGGETVADGDPATPSITAMTTLSCRMTTQTCSSSCAHGCTTSAGAPVNAGNTASDTRPLTCDPESNPPMCGSTESGTENCAFGCTASPGGETVADGETATPSTTATTTLSCRETTQTCSSSCAHGCTTSAGAPVNAGNTASDTRPLTCDPETARTCTCQHGCMLTNGERAGDVVVHNAPIPRSTTTTTTFTCNSAPVTPPGTQICECRHGCTGDDSNEYNNNAPAPDSVMLTCKPAPVTPPGGGNSPGVSCCSFTAHVAATVTKAANIRDNDAEFRAQTGLRTIKNEYALALNAMGKGVTIGIADTGFDHLHPDLGKDKFLDKSILAYYAGRISDVPAPDATPHKDLIEKYRCPGGGFGYETDNPDREALLIANCQTDENFFRQPDANNQGEFIFWNIPLLGRPGFTQKNISHGTAVAGIAVAQRDGGTDEDNLMGVAPEARLLTVAFDGVRGDRFFHDIDFLAPHSQVINFSFNDSVLVHTRTETQVRELHSDAIGSVQRGTIATGELRAGEQPLYVVTSGNDNQAMMGGAPYPATFPGLPYHVEELRGRWLAVTAVMATESPAAAHITNFANRCGALPTDWITDRTNAAYAGRHYCLAAPGGEVPSLLAGAHNSMGYETSKRSGTSFAAPHVAGALAVLIGHFDTLSLKEILIRMVDSANNTDYTGGDPDNPEGPDFSDVATFGAGLLDMEAALRPMGEMQAMMGSSLRGVSLPLAGSRITAGAAYGDALSLAFRGRTMAGFDEYHAPFPQPLSGLLTTPHSLSLEGRRDRLASFDLETTHLIDGSVHHVGEHGMAAILPLGEGYNIKSGTPHLFMAHQASHGLPLGLRALEIPPLLTADPSAFSNPFLGLAEQGMTVGMGQHYGDGVLRMAAFTGTGLMTTEDGLPNRNTRGKAHGVVVDYAISPTDDMSLSLAVGALMEDGQMLGLASEGAFGTLPPVPALFSGVTLAGRLSGALTFIAQAHGGVARPEAPSPGLVKSTSPVIASAFSAGLTGSDIIRAGDQLSLIISQPLRIEAGEMGLSWATGRTIDGLLLHGNADVTLTPSGREITIGVGHRAPLGDNITMEVRAGATRHSGHNAAAKTQLFGLAGLDLDF